MSGLAKAIYTTLRDNTGIKCPHGCSGCGVRIFSLVKHLMEIHDYTEEDAWKKAKRAVNLWVK